MKSSQPLTISFEFFPPKTPEGMDNLAAAAQTLAACSPYFFSVTFGAGGSTRDGTVDTVRLLQLQTGVEVAPHLASIGSSRDDIFEMLQIYKNLGVKRIVALRGDLPSGMGHSTGDLLYANDLVAFIRETTGDYFHIEVAAYPEMHPQAYSFSDDMSYFKAKCEAGANSAITQYFFNPDAYFYFLDDCARQGIYVPVVPGIMPITQFSKLARFSDRCGAEIPRWMRKRLEGYGDDSDSIKAFGLEVITNLCERLIAGGAPGLHFYTLNHAEETIKIVKSLNLTITRLKHYPQAQEA
jgi:methylenetetrahydrofolate reductase (NADPH)